MPFKIHLIIVSCIIAVVLLAWETLPKKSNQQPATAGAQSRRIIVTHASWGLNCRGVVVSGKPQPDKIKEDNVFSSVSLACNGKTECELTSSDAQLGPDPMPECNNKTLEVEYRCFSYDRPWNVKTQGGSVKLMCSAS